MLSERAIQKYKEIYESEVGIELSDDEAREQATRFLNLARIVLAPMPKVWQERYNEIRKKDPEGSQKKD